MSKQTVIAAIASVAATLALCAMTPPAFAAAPAPVNAVQVRHAGLDLNTSEGQAKLNRRIENAARSVCGMDTMQTGTRIHSRSSTECYQNALRQIQPQFARLINSDRRGA